MSGIIFTILLFLFLFFPTLFMTKKIFDDELKYADIAFALVSAFTTTMMLSDPFTFFRLYINKGFILFVLLVLVAIFCLFSVGAFIFMLFLGIKIRIRSLFQRDNFYHEFPITPIHVQDVQMTEDEVEEDLRISKVGREQIIRLIQAEKKDYVGKKKSGYIFISSEFRQEDGEPN